MQFQLTRYEYVKSIEFKTTTPILNVDRIRYFKEFELTGNFISKEFRYSWDDNIWTNWNTLTQGNLAGIEFRDRPNFYIHVRYNRTGVGTANIQRFYLYYDSTIPTPPAPPDASIDAFTLQGELPAYYLDRTNHLGPYTDIVIQNLDNGGTIGVYDSRVDTSVGTTFYFKRIGGRGGINVYEEPFGKIVVDGSAISSNISALDSSVSNLYSVIELLDSSISYLIGWNSSIDASIIRIDSSIADLYSRDVSIGVVNVGGGVAGSFAGFDASNNIRLRTFASGSPQAVVTEVGDQIIITLDASYSGEANYGINLGGGDASIYAGKTGDGLEFREIKGIGSVIVSTSDNLILIDSSGGGSGTYDTSLDPSLAMPTSVGGIPAGTKVSDLSGDTFIQLFDNLLFPTVNPTFVAPNNAFADNQGPYEEIGDSINITFTASFSRGQILLSGSFQDYRSGLPNTYNYTGSGLPATVSSVNLSDIRSVTGYIVLPGIQSWTNTVSYDAGVQPYDSKGNPYNSPLAAGTTTAKSVSLEGVYPLFGTTVNISTLTKQTLVSMISGNNIQFNMVPESLGEKQKFEIPDMWLISRPLLGIQTYNAFTMNWEYEGGNAAQSLLRWTTSSVQETIQGNSINYARYTYNSTDRSSIQIRLIF